MAWGEMGWLPKYLALGDLRRRGDGKSFTAEAAEERGCREETLTLSG